MILEPFKPREDVFEPMRLVIHVQDVAASKDMGRIPLQD